MKRLLCYAHFDVSGQVKPFVKHSLHAMQSSCGTTIFVSNSPVTEDDRAELFSICSQVLINPNTGYDFYMWKLALEKVDVSLYDEVILMNSSIYGPISDMGQVFAQMERLECDFWGITECFQNQPHIQSYFLVFRRRVTESQAFRNFWEGVLPYVNKLQVIHSYEVGLTQWLLESGFKPGVLCGFERLINCSKTSGKRLRKKDNTSVKHAQELLAIGNPFLKRDAVRNRKVDMKQVLPYLRQHSYPTELINEQTQKEEKPCPLCGASSTIYRKSVKDYIWLHNINRYDYYRCNSAACRIVWIDSGTMNRPPLAAYPKLPPRLHPAKLQIPDLMKKCEPGKILILGCDNESDRSQLSELGHQASKHYTISFGTYEKSGLNILTTDVSKGEELFDIILVNTVFEMSAEPMKELAEYNRLLKPGGTLYLQTPNIKSAFSLLFKNYWSGLNAPRNKFLYNRKALKNLLSKNGFIDVKVSTNIARAHEYAWHSFNIFRNKWDSSRINVPFSGVLVSVLKIFMLVLDSVSGCGGDDIIGVGRKPIISR